MPEDFNSLFSSTEDIILFVMAVAVLVVFAGCIYAFFYAIYLFIFSKGEDSKRKKARDSIRYMIIGLFLTVMLLFIGPQILRLFKLPNYEQYSAKNVFSKIGSVITGVGTVIGIVARDYPGVGIDESTSRDTSSTSYQL
ncbi:hypothetical protein AGMMS50249_4540 [candidate division SR1 bacterium]|nr:hypothetical protein AGMMS50249_4540 [candidate division SR1 bacterium]